MSSPTSSFTAASAQLLAPASKASGTSLTPTLPMVSSTGAGVGQALERRQPTPLARVPKETKKIIQTQDAKNPAWKMLNQYRVIRLLGRGTHGTVKYGEDMSKNDLRDPDYAVAIKIIKRMPQRKRLPRADGRERTNSALSRIRYEVAVMKRCSHDHIVRLIEVIDDPRSQAVFLVMEYLEGGEIKWRGPEKPLLSLGQTRRIVRDVLLGLEYLHYMGIIHRDIKPANMLWTKGRARVKLTDFGVAHFAKPLPDGTPSNNTSTQADNDEHLFKTEGTPAFYAPEQAYNHNGLPVPTFKLGRRPPGVRNDQIFPMTKALDIWAFGVSIYCFLFGKPPFWAPNVHLLCKEIIETEYIIPAYATADQTPTGGDDADLEEALRLMKGMMTKPVHARITLAKAKISPWLTGDLDDPEAWLRETDPEMKESIMVTGNEPEKAVATKGHAGRVAGIMKALWHRRENSRHPPTGRSDIKSIKGASQVSLEHSTHRHLPAKPRSLYRPSAEQPSSPVDGPSVTSTASSPTGTSHFGEFYFSRALVASGSHSRSGGLTRMVSSLFRRNKKSTSAEAIMTAPVSITPIRPLENISASSSPPGEVSTSMHQRSTFSADEQEMDPILITYSSEEDDDDEDGDVGLIGFGGYETHGLNSNGASPSEASQSFGRIRRHEGDRTTRSVPIVLGRAFSTSSDMPTAPERIYDSPYPQHTHKATPDDYTADTVTEPSSSPKQQTIYIAGASGPLAPSGHTHSRSVGRNTLASDDESDEEEEGLEMRHRVRHNDS